MGVIDIFNLAKKISNRQVIKRMANNCQESSLIAVIFTFLNFFAYPEIILISITRNSVHHSPAFDILFIGCVLNTKIIQLLRN